MKPLPFRFKIASLSALISGFVLLGFGAASGYLLYQQKVQGVDTEIRALGTRHPGWLANRANFDRFNTSLQFIFGEEHKGQILLLVKDAQGQTLYVSPGWPKAIATEQIDCSLADDASLRTQSSNDAAASGAPGPPRGAGVGKGRGGLGRGLGPGRGGGSGGGGVVFTKIPKFFTAKTVEGTWRLGIMGNDDLRLVVGLNYDAVQTELNRMGNIFLVTVPFALLLIGGGGWWVAGHALGPLKMIARTVEQVTARGLDQRIPASDEDPEIGRLIQVLNGMMDRLEASFRQATRFTADASHELKTPLAIMQGELENAIPNSTPGSPEQATFSSLLEETQQLKRITSNLLLLAQADAGQLKLTLEEILLSEDLEAMIEDAQILAADSNIQFTLHVQPGVRVRGDRALLRMALMNLITNAVRYNEPGGSAGLTLATGNDVALTICNTGPGIPAADQPRIFDRFYRVRQAGSRPMDGLGLGLSLAREIILAHRGTLLLKESRPGHTCFTVSLKHDPSC
jgi:two-component system, OmpR family, heavy metal sensor histidine kinase CusS